MTYAIFDSHTREIIRDGFKNRQEAKIIRNKFNAEVASDETRAAVKEVNGQPRFIVTKSKTHYDGFTDHDQIPSVSWTKVIKEKIEKSEGEETIEEPKVKKKKKKSKE